ncbi:MAG TPA: hypothetical protein VMU34_12860 [Mycobacterium sp.]|nr:hypothetical protein [Mycobacterium sp.]
MTLPASPAETIVRIWERGRREHPIDRALTILSLLSGQSRGELAAMSLERRDAQLLTWREQLFGREFPGYANCPRCGCAVDVALTVDSDDELDDRFTVQVGSRRVVARLPTTLDLVAVAGLVSVDESSRALVARCIEDGGEGDRSAVTDEVMGAVAAELDRRAGLSAAAVALACPDCAHEWQLELDIAEFLWREIDIRAIRLLRDVDLLARRYGWSEREILALSPTRRSFYLELAS